MATAALAPAPEQLAKLCALAQLWPLSVEQYEHMIAAGVLGQSTAVELIDGFLVGKDRGGGPGITEGPVHATAVDQVGDVVAACLGGSGWIVRCQHPVALGDVTVPGAGSEPEPDGAVARGPRRRYADHHPTAADIGLLIEVADSRLAFDRDVKGSAYAAAGIEFYWIVNLVDRQVEVFSEPAAAARVYRRRETFVCGQTVRLGLPGLGAVEVKVEELLP